MTKKEVHKTDLKIKLVTIFVLSASLCCLPSFSKETTSYGYLADAKPLKLINPIYLDTSQTEKVIPKANTSIPFNLRQFDESDYFTSVIDDSEPVSETTKPPKLLPLADLEEIPPPSEYKPVNNTVVTKEKELEPLPDFDNNLHFFAPTPTVTQTETPQEKAIEVNFAEKTKDNPIKETFDKEENSFNIFTASAQTQSSENVEIDGKTINSIEILGLKLISSDTILSEISSQEGGICNSAILQKDLQKIYSTGYFTDEMSIEPVLNTDNTVNLSFTVKENPLVKDVMINGNTVFSTSELMPYIISIKGLPQNLNTINTAIDNINNHYREQGYILANVSSVDDDADGLLSFTIQEGIINKIEISGNEKTKEYVITRNIMTQPGSIYNEEFLKKDLAKIFSTQIFDEVNRNITPSENDDGTFNVTVVVKEKSTNSLALGGGIDTGLGAFGSVSLKEENFLGKAQKVSLTGILGSGILLSDASIKNHMNYHVELSFFEPHFINADNSLMSKLYYREMGSWSVPLAIERRIGANIGVEHQVKDIEKLSTSFHAGIEHVNMREGDFHKISQLYNQNGLNIARRAKQLDDGFFIHLTPGIRYKSLDNDENPREGIIAQARFTESIGVTDLDHTNGRLAGMVTKFFPVFKKSSFSLTAKGGIKVHGDKMPEFMAYQLGGPYSIRGYRMNGVGAGESFVMGSAELATPLPFVDRLKWDIFKKMRLTFFVDAGKVFDPTISNVLFDRPEHAITAGIGLRVYIPGIGPMSIDYGLPITNPGSYGSKNGYFTFGTGGLNGMYGY